MPDGQIFHFVGPDLSKGMLPAIFYFAVEGFESLSLDPFNQFLEKIELSRMRVFSTTLPGHGEGLERKQALHYWAEKLAKGQDVLTPFFTATSHNILQLLAEAVIHPHALAFCGLSRGAFIATHLAAKVKSCHYLLGLAPLTQLSAIEPLAQLDTSTLDLSSVIGQLGHLKNLRFYIGNRDTLVGTQRAFKWISDLVEYNYEHRCKLAVEFIMTPSIGMKGHGTSTETFQEASTWLTQRILHGPIPCYTHSQ